MSAPVSPLEIRRLVRQQFAALSGVADSDAFCETILMQEGRYMARSYRQDDLFAMWMPEIGLVQFYDAEGNLLRSLSTLDETASGKAVSGEAAVEREPSSHNRAA